MIPLRAASDGHHQRAMFVLADVCAVLTIGNTAMASERLDDDEKSNLSLTEVGENQGLMDNGGRAPIIISEAGLSGRTVAGLAAG